MVESGRSLRLRGLLTSPACPPRARRRAGAAVEAQIEARELRRRPNPSAPSCEPWRRPDRPSLSSPPLPLCLPSLPRQLLAASCADLRAAAASPPPPLPPPAPYHGGGRIQAARAASSVRAGGSEEQVAAFFLERRRGAAGKGPDANSMVRVGFPLGHVSLGECSVAPSPSSPRCIVYRVWLRNLFIIKPAKAHLLRIILFLPSCCPPLRLAALVVQWRMHD